MAQNSLLILLALTLSAVHARSIASNTNTPAENARYLLSKTEWISIATISTIDEIKDYPFVNVKSTADGESGIPYLYFMDLDLSVIDLHANNKVSILATFAGSECKDHNLDPQDPRCPRLILSGYFEKVEGEEEQFGKKALIEKHPVIKEWEQVHGFYVAKVVIEKVIYLGKYGGAEHIDVNDYFKADPNAVKNF